MPQVRDLFLYIAEYQPHDIELDCRLKPFIPDFIPAVGVLGRRTFGKTRLTVELR